MLLKGFQSTPPVKAATAAIGTQMSAVDISIHAAREGGDGVTTAAELSPLLFQSTPPVKAATSWKHSMGTLG